MRIVWLCGRTKSGRECPTSFNKYLLLSAPGKAGADGTGTAAALGKLTVETNSDIGTAERERQARLRTVVGVDFSEVYLKPESWK